MAKLPRSPIAQGVSNQYRPVQEARASGADPVGQALEGAGNAGFEIASRMADAKIAADAARAELELANRLDLERRALEDDNELDPASIEPMFQERASAAVNEIAGNIRSPALKRAFALKSAETLQRHTFQVRDVSRRKQVDRARGEFVTLMNDYGKTYDEPANYLVPKGSETSPAQDQLDSQKAFIQTQMTAGVIDAETAALQMAKAEDAFKKGLERKHLKAIDDALDNGDYSGADSYFMAHSGEIDDPDVREKTRDVIEAKRRDGEAISKADEFWSKSGGDYGAAIAEAAQIENPDERLAVESRIAQLKNQGDAAEEANDKRSLAAGMEYITTGRSIPASVMRDASPKVRDILQTEVRTRQMWDQQMATLSAEQKAALKQASVLSMDYLKMTAVNEGFRETYLSGPENWPKEMKDEYDRLSPEHKSDILLDIETKLAGGGTLDAVEAVASDVIKQIPMFGPSGRVGKDFAFDSESTGEALDEERAVLSSIYRQAQDHAKRTGGAPITPQETKVMIARAFRAANPATYPYAPGDKPKSVAQAAREAVAIREDLRAVLGREPTQAEINQIAQELAR